MQWGCSLHECHTGTSCFNMDLVVVLHKDTRPVAGTSNLCRCYQGAYTNKAPWCYRRKGRWLHLPLFSRRGSFTLRVQLRLAPIEISCQEYGPSSPIYRSRRYESNQNIQVTFYSSLIVLSFNDSGGSIFLDSLTTATYAIAWYKTKGFSETWRPGLPLPCPSLPSPRLLQWPTRYYNNY